MNSENRKRQRWNHRMGPVNFVRVRNRLCLANENDEDVTQVNLFITTRMGTKGKELDLETKSAIDEVQDRIENSRENVDEAFQAVLGKERSGRVRGYGRGVTKTSLKMDVEIDAVKRKHYEEMLILKTEMENQKQNTDNQMNNMKKQVEGLENLIKALLERASPGVNLEDLAPLMRSSPADANSAPNMDKNGLPHFYIDAYSKPRKVRIYQIKQNKCILHVDTIMEICQGYSALVFLFFHLCYVIKNNRTTFVQQ